MELYLIRHGIALDRSAELPDSARPLTEKGWQKTQNLAQRWQSLGLQFDAVLTSPLLRAQQTAALLYQANLSSTLMESDHLAPAGDLSAWLNWYGESKYNKESSRLALVGHQPNLGDWAELLVWGQAQGKLILKKTDVIGLQVPPIPNSIGQSQLFLLSSPKWV